MKRRLLFISNLFPNPLFPGKGIFNRQMIDVLREYYDIDVISPVAWTAQLRMASYIPPGLDTDHGIYHPLYLYPPGFLRTLHGQCFYHSIRSIARQLIRRYEYEMIYSSWLYPDSWAAARLAREHGLPLYVKVLGTDVNRLRAGTALARKSLAVAVEARRVLCVSEALRERLLALGCPPERAVMLRNGVNREIFKPRPREEARRELGFAPSGRVILFVGNLLKSKGLRELLSAYRMISRPDLHLVIIGDGPCAAETRSLTARFPNPEQVHLMGALPLERVALWMNAAHLLCLPSHMEGLPNVVLEALASGLPVVATRVGGIPELERGDGSLTLVEPRSVAELAGALQRQLDRGDGGGDSSFICSWQESVAQLAGILSSSRGFTV